MALCEVVIHNLQIDHIAKNQHNVVIYPTTTILNLYN
jgi:hypothetical protein